MLAIALKNLIKNGFQAQYVETGAEAKALVLGMIPPGAPVGIGGSVTIRQLNFIETLRQQGHAVYDHWQEGLSPEEIREVQLHHVTSPFFLTSTNAITQDGKLVNIDNTGNRVAAMILGPQQVIVVASKQKIVADVDAALKRIKEEVTPLVARRLRYNTPCAVTGTCEDCDSPHRLCRATCVLERKTRGVRAFSVIIVGEALGI